MTSSKKMRDIWPFEAILGDLNSEVLQMTPISSSTFHDLSDRTVKIPFWELFKNFVYRDLYWKVTSSINGPKRVQNFSNRLRDLCAKFQPHSIFFKVKAFFELILPDYYPDITEDKVNLISGFSGSGWKKAVKWSRRSYRNAIFG